MLKVKSNVWKPVSYTHLPFLVYINNQLVVNSLDNAEVSQYGRVSAGSQTVTVTGQNGYVYIQKQITVRSGGALTVAIINRPGGLDLQEITDNSCNSNNNTGCFRVCNLSVTNQNINASLNGGLVTFRSVSYREVTGFRFQMCIRDRSRSATSRGICVKWFRGIYAPYHKGYGKMGNKL